LFPPCVILLSVSYHGMFFVFLIISIVLGMLLFLGMSESYTRCSPSIANGFQKKTVLAGGFSDMGRKKQNIELLYSN